MRPRVNWLLADLDYTGVQVTAESIYRDYARPGTHPRLYQAWIPIWLLSERLWEDIDGGYYDWSEYRSYGIYPPIKLEIDAVVRDSMSYIHMLHIRDGNHRVRYWRRCGFSDVPAWVLDYR